RQSCPARRGEPLTEAGAQTSPSVDFVQEGWRCDHCALHMYGWSRGSMLPCWSLFVCS
ncbi:hypothetical protein V5799_007289, partial [Amblyomma americanum]